MNDVKMLPKFKYHPNLYKNEIVTYESGVCQCCGKEVEAYIPTMYSVADISCICLPCVADGSATAKFDGSFIQDAEPVTDPAKTEELFARTRAMSVGKANIGLHAVMITAPFLEMSAQKNWKKWELLTKYLMTTKPRVMHMKMSVSILKKPVPWPDTYFSVFTAKNIIYGLMLINQSLHIIITYKRKALL